MELTIEEAIAVSEDSESAIATLTEIFNNIEDYKKEIKMLRAEKKANEAKVEEIFFVSNFRMKYRDSRGVQHAISKSMQDDSLYKVMIVKER